MGLVAKRYALAFADLSASKNTFGEYSDELAEISDIYESQDDLRDFLLNPKNELSAKKTVLTNIFSDRIQPDVLHLLFLLLDKGRIGSLPAIRRQYMKLANERQNILELTIMTALPLEPEQIDSISGVFQKLFHTASVKAAVQIDPTLIGGVKIAVRDKIYDGTIKGKLSGLQSLLDG